MRILIIDDETNIRDLMVRYMKIEGIEGVGAENAYSAQRVLREQKFDGILVDLKMPGMDGFELVRWIRDEGFRMPIIMMSAHGEITDAVNAMKHGVQDYIVKPFDPEEVIIKLKNLVEAQNFRTLQEMEERLPQGRAFIGESVQIRKIKDTIARIAATNSSVLITGESGTGKEVVARSIHEQSTVSSGPFVAINIGGVPENLLESELFGYEKGAFTGADSQHKGRFEIADGGTIFLDEIGEINQATQVKLLRVIQERSFERVGGTQPINVDVRIVAATNRNLEEEVKNGKFREDLFYRLNVVRIPMPALRERKDDIPLLLHNFLREFNIENEKNITGFDNRAKAAILKYSWPGNISELKNCVESAVVMCTGNEIKIDDLPASVREKGEEKVINIPVGMKLDDAELLIIQENLAFCNGNKTKCAELLGIGRKTLHRKLGVED